MPAETPAAPRPAAGRRPHRVESPAPEHPPGVLRGARSALTLGLTAGGTRMRPSPPFSPPASDPWRRGRGGESDQVTIEHGRLAAVIAGAALHGGDAEERVSALRWAPARPSGREVNFRPGWRS